MWFVLGPLIFYLESLVFRYIPLARGDVGEKKEGLPSFLPVRNMWRSLLASWRFLEGKQRTTDASASPAFYYRTWYGFTWAQMQQLYVLAAFSVLLSEVIAKLLLYTCSSFCTFVSHPLGGKVRCFHLLYGQRKPVISDDSCFLLDKLRWVHLLAAGLPQSHTHFHIKSTFNMPTLKQANLSRSRRQVGREYDPGVVDPWIDWLIRCQNFLQDLG